jgi:hypothetical protein
MAKRPSSRSKTSGAEEPAQPKPKRSRATSAGARAEEPVAIQATEPSDDDIRRRAYQRYLERGGDHGQHFDDWLEAERELRSKK